MTMPKIFVSHSNADNAWCRPFIAALQQAGYDVWYDEKDMPVGASFPSVIGAEIEARQVFVVVLTPDAWASRWVKDEIDLALDRNHFIIQVLLRPTDITGLLRTRQRIDATSLGSADAAQRAIGAIAAHFGLSVAPPVQAPVSPTPQPRPVVAPPPAPAHPAFLPDSLARLGFVGDVRNGVEVIIPPVCAVPAGPFTMGDGKDSNNKQHTVDIKQPYQIGKFPVTVAEYACAVRAKALREPPDSLGVNWKTQLGRLDHPAVCISWKDAVAYARWLAQVTGQPWRLPTEAEWEKAARGTDGRSYPWGAQWDESRANTSYGGPDTTTPVGAYAAKGDASPYGAHDQAGNVWEWCSSLYKPYPYKNDDGRESMGDSSEARVLRGGSWYITPEYARAAFRHRFLPGYIYPYLGVRLARGAGAGT